MHWLVRDLSCKPNIYIHIWTKGEVGAPLNRFKPPVKYAYWPFRGGASFVDHLCYFCLVCYAFMLVCLLLPCGHLLGKGWPVCSRLRCLIVTLSLSHWYPGSGEVLGCIDSWSLPSFLLPTMWYVRPAKHQISLGIRAVWSEPLRLSC